MEKYETICENREFCRIYSRGKSYVGNFVVTYVLRGRSGKLRFGITSGKKVGNAVKRNRSRRVIREAIRSLFPKTKAGYDLVFVARTRAALVKSSEIEAEMEKHLRKAGLL